MSSEPRRPGVVVSEGEVPLTWDNVYLLGWEDHGGRRYLTTWSGSPVNCHVVVAGCSPMYMPMCNAPVRRGSLFQVPVGEDPREFARSNGGFYAFGWWVDRSIPVVPVNPQSVWDRL